MESNNRIGLAIFSDEVDYRVPLGNVESNQQLMQSHIRSLRANGGTELFRALSQMVGALTAQATDENRIRAIVLLSDGADTRRSAASTAAGCRAGD
jgi:Mg-chelatase subunit ChlD